MRLLAALIALPLLQAQEVSKEDARKLANVCMPADEDTFGLTCSENDPCAVFLELSSIEANGTSLFVTGNLHTVNTTMYGLLLETQDGGETWTEPNKRIRSSALEQIQFLDFQHGWISGAKLDPLPRDAFLLSTTDGGRSWRMNPLSDDSISGSIQQFWFESPNAGELVLDRSQGATTRYERYVSMTGGASWELQQTDSKPIRLSKAAPNGSSSFRVRADTDAYRIERRTTSGDWESIARFAIHAGDCK